MTIIGFVMASGGLVSFFILENPSVSLALMLAGVVAISGVPSTKTIKKSMKLTLSAILAMVAITLYYYSKYGVEEIINEFDSWLFGAFVVGLVAIFIKTLVEKNR